MQAPPDDLVPLTLRRPRSLRGRVPGGGRALQVAAVLGERAIPTVCETSRCLNRGTCWAEGTATLQLLGEVCTRGCRFCHTGRGGRPGPLDESEPERVASAVEALGLDYAVLTSVDRDDLPDGGAAQLAACLRAVRARVPSVRLEILLPDFGGNERALAQVAGAGADVFAHNLETVERLTPRVRDRRAGYRRSLDVLGALAAFLPHAVTKSGLMLGLGETDAELLGAMRDLLDAGVRVLTLGQYVPPSPRHLVVERWVEGARFAELEEEALRQGFRAVASGPLVRSSFRAHDLYARAVTR